MRSPEESAYPPDKGDGLPADAFWAEVEAAFSAVLELGEEAARVLLDRRCADRPAVRVEVESLLAAHRRAEHFMQHPTMPAELPETCPLGAGDVVGQFRLVESIGSGGMATVFRAERADGAFVQRVAVKVISLPLTQEDVKNRFLAERQILASLHHPHIVSLLDAGLTPHGHAYLIMELVDGTPITTYCRERALPVAARLRLLRQVCDAVQYAHANFVVHRDLKPANVLVTADGVPKVLDFGIATLLESSVAGEESAGSAVAAGAEPLTPNYASPEQLRGERITVASDVYALGMLLFELIAGVRPYEVGGRPREEAIRIVGETPTLRPSEAQPFDEARPPYDWRRALRGDLDAIALRACHRAPERRYASADALSQDIGRHLRGEPVDARKPTLGYIVGKIALRHRVAFASLMVSSALVVGALGIALWQAHAARIQRERAERRFNEVRELANAVIFRIHDAIAPLPGSTPVRQTIVAEGLKYLERLTADAAGDPGLQLELGRAYLKIGAVQGRPNTANLGDRDGAVTSFRKARALLAPLAQRPDVTPIVFSSYLDALRFSSETLAGIGGSHRDEALAAAQDAVREVERFAASHPTLDQAQSFTGAAEFVLAQRLNGQEARDHWQKAAVAYEALLARAPDDPVRQRNVALVEKYVGGSFEHERNYAASLKHHTRALELDQKRFDRAPEDRVVQFDLAIDLSNVAYSHWREGQLSEAAELFSRSLSMRERLMASDPKDALSQEKVAFLHRQLGSLYEEKGDAALALKHYRLACETASPIQSGSVGARLHAADSWTGIARLERARTDLACDANRRAFELYRSVTELDRRGIADGNSDPLPGIARAAARCGYAAALKWASPDAR